VTSTRLFAFYAFYFLAQLLSDLPTGRYSIQFFALIRSKRPIALREIIGLFHWSQWPIDFLLNWLLGGLLGPESLLDLLRLWPVACVTGSVLPVTGRIIGACRLVRSAGRLKFGLLLSTRPIYRRGGILWFAGSRVLFVDSPLTSSRASL